MEKRIFRIWTFVSTTRIKLLEYEPFLSKIFIHIFVRAYRFIILSCKVAILRDFIAKSFLHNNFPLHLRITFFYSLSFIAEKDYQNSFAFYSFENFYLPYFARSYHFIVKSLQFFFAYILSYFLPFFTINHRKEKMHEEFSELEFAFRIPTAKTWKIRVRFIPLFLSLRKKASNNKLSRIREPAAIPPSHGRCVVSFRLKCELGSTCKLRLESELETSLDTLWKRSSPPVLEQRVTLR